MIPKRNFRRFFQKSLKQPSYALKVLIKRLRASTYYFITAGKSSYPEAITLFLTHRCNLHCKMCGQWGEAGVTKKQGSQYIKEELPLEELKALINDISNFGPNLTLFGGEPLLYAGCIELIRHIKRKKMHCLMISNGFLFKALAEKIVSSGLDELNVSLDGDALLHDEIRGMAGLFDKIMAGLKKINYFKAKYGKKKPLINLQCTINKNNYSDLGRLISVAKEAKANSLTFHNLIFLNRDILNKQEECDRLLNCSSSDWEGFIFEPGIEPKLLYGEIKEIMSGSYGFSVDFYPNFSQKSLNEYYRDPSCVSVEYPRRCLSPWMAAYIFPGGEVRPCLNCNYSYGNIKNNRFIEIWNNRLAVRYRLILKERRIFPVCTRCSELYRY